MTLSPAIGQAIDEVADLLAHSWSLLFITGAGISAESGLPTYRGVGGLYNANETEAGLPIEDLLSGNGLDRHPVLSWKYLGQVERACRGARFNRAHEIIAQIEASFDRVWTLTQNVDGLHRQAGSRNVIDIHGDIHNLRCTECGFTETLADYSALNLPPSCPECRGLIRPDVVLFGEPLPAEKVTRLYSEIEDGFDLIFSVGTT